MRPIGCPKTSVRNYQKIAEPQERMMTKIQVLWDIMPCRMEKLPTFRGYTTLKMKATSSTEKSATMYQSRRRHTP